MNHRFEHIINSSKPVLVDFYADWCVPCRQVPPILRKVKSELKSAIRIVKVNVDRNPYIATQYKVQNLPTIMVFKKGTPQCKIEGLCDPEEIKSVIKKQINGK
jgi:thioredoxin 1